MKPPGASLVIVLPGVLVPPDDAEVSIVAGAAAPVIIARWPSRRVAWRPYRGGGSVLRVKLDELRHGAHLAVAAAVADRRAAVTIEHTGAFVTSIAIVPRSTVGRNVAGGVALSYSGSDPDVRTMALRLAVADAKSHGLVLHRP
jgi:hypothetical protein